MFPIRLRTDESTNILGEILQLSAEIGAEGAVLFGGILVVYVIIGALTTTIMKSGTSYPILSLEADPVFLITGTIVGIFTVQAAGSLLLYHYYVGIKDETVSSVVLSFVALGIGGALLDVTVPGTWRLLIGLL